MAVLDRTTESNRLHAPAAGLFGWHRASECTGRCVEIKPDAFSALYTQPCICKRPRRFDCLVLPTY